MWESRLRTGDVVCITISMTPMHRKRKRTYNEPGHAHYLTFSCQERLSLLSRDRSREWVVQSIDGARRRHSMSL